MMRLAVINDSGVNGGGTENRLRLLLQRLERTSAVEKIYVLLHPQKLSEALQLKFSEKISFRAAPIAWKKSRPFYERFLLESNIHLVQAHNLNVLSPQVLDVAKKLRIPTIWMAHDYWPFCAYKSFVDIKRDASTLCPGFSWKNCVPCADTKSYLRLAIFRWMMRDVNIAIAAGQKVIDQFAKYAFLEGRWSIVRPWIDTGIYRGQVLSEQPRDDHFLFVGSLKDYKGIWVLLKAFAMFVQFEPKARLRIISPQATEAEKKPLVDFLREHKLQPKVDWASNYCAEQLQEEYRRARALIFPSVCLETFGLVWAEALCCGCPIIVSDRGGIAEYAAQAGLVFEGENVDQLVERMAVTWQSSQNDLEAAQKRASWAQTHFCPERATEEMLAIYDDLLSFPTQPISSGGVLKNQ